MSQVLFLSSDPVLRQKNIEVLSQSGLDTTGVATCLDGLLIIDKNGIEVVVIDEELADMSGYEACIRVRQHSDISMVLLGSVTESEVWAKVEELGFDIYLRKPISPRELMARIRALLRRPVLEKRESIAIGEKPVEAKPSAIQSDVVRPAPAVPIEIPKEKVEPAILRKETEPPVQIVQPLPTDVTNMQTTPPQPQLISQREVEMPVQVVPPLPGETKETAIPPRQPIVVPSQPEVQPVQPRITRQEPDVQRPPISIPSVQPVSQQQKEPVIVQVPKEQNIRPVVREQVGIPQVGQEHRVVEETNETALEDVRTLKLVDALVNGKLTEIAPVIDLSLKLGYGYPVVDSLIDASDQETAGILENLARNEILIKSPFEKLYTDPEGLMQLVPIERCPRCDSGNLIKGQLVEHFNCGYVGLDKEYRQDGRYVCPKCHRELRLIGTDYRNIGIHYRCLDCNEVFTTPIVKWRNLKTRKVWTAEELTEVTVYSYIFSPDKKGWLEFQLKPKTQLVDFLKRQGYQVQELAQLAGSSGAMHTVDILAIRDDILTKINLGIGLLVASPGESEVSLEALFKFDTRAYDVGINYKVVIAIPKLGYEATNFANRQMIRAFEAKTLGSVVSDITGKPSARLSSQGAAESGQMYNGQSPVASARTTIGRFLRNRGYEVFERAQILGKSGVDHIFDIYARRDDKIITPTMAIGIVSNPSGQPVGIDEIAKFDASAYDSGIRNKIFLGIPVISPQARQFARQQRIDVLEPNDLGRLI
ncbi:MAG: response regulator [Dehalococcoidia bacterium]|nr:response regulator [Dehalococcoidia bacterium]